MTDVRNMKERSYTPEWNMNLRLMRQPDPYWNGMLRRSVRKDRRGMQQKWVRIKEKGYIPTTKDGYVIKSGSVSIKAGRYYVSVLVEIHNNKIANNSNEGIGIELGFKDFAIVSNGKTYKNINKSVRLKKLEKQLVREQRCLSCKYENLKEGEVTQKTNIQKQKLKVQKLWSAQELVSRYDFGQSKTCTVKQ